MQKTLILIKALSDTQRVRIVMALSHGELCLCYFQEMLGLAPSTVSRHVSILQKAGLVSARKQGKWTYFRLVTSNEEPSGKTLLRWLQETLDEDVSVRADRETIRKLKKEENKRCGH